MDTKKHFIAAGSSGIGLEIVKALKAPKKRGNQIYVGSRTIDQLAEIDGVHHLSLNVKDKELNLEELPGLPARLYTLTAG